MPAIDKLIINGFKAFPSRFELNFEGKHLLLYGENGSGKSSIYYALHCLFHSQQKKDEGKKYFTRTDSSGNINNQHLINLNFNDDDAHIELCMQGNLVQYKIDSEGLTITQKTTFAERLQTDIGVFINHKFLFHFFSFKNSELINLFPVFENDILPYCNVSKNRSLANVYDDLKFVPKNGKRIFKGYHDKVVSFNREIFKVIEKINLSVNDIFNKYFKDSDDKELKISLHYPQINDLPDSILNGYWLIYDYLRFISLENGNKIDKRNSYRSHNSPFIRLQVEELQKDGSWRDISKPQVYFNEAKLTAIALSVRFALVDLIAPPEGSFLALDDMLISLDMSNRTKVIDFLLSISDKYKIYLFTHDFNFYELVKKKIEREHKKGGEWTMGKIYKNEFIYPPSPEFMLDKCKIDVAMQYLIKHDYPASGVHLRRECEKILESLLPFSLRQKVHDQDQTNIKTENLNLNDQIINLEIFCSKEGIDYAPFKALKTYKDVLLNALAHNDSKSPIFKRELLSLIDSLKSLQKINRCKEIIKCGKDVSFKLQNISDEEVVVCIRSREKWVILEVADDTKKLSYYGKCEVTKLIHNGIHTPIHQTYESVYDIYNHYCSVYNVEATSDLLNIIEYKGNSLFTILNTPIGHEYTK